MSNDVFVWVEQASGQVDSIAWETLGLARRLAEGLGGKVGAIILGEKAAEVAGLAIQYGADKVFTADDITLTHFRLEPYAAIVVKLAREQEPAALLLGASNAGLELAAYVAARLGVGLAPDCLDLTVKDDRLVATRPMLAGNVLARLTFGPARPWMATIRGRVFPVPVLDPGRSGEITEVRPVLAEAEIVCKIEGFESAADRVSLANANVIIAGGRGVGGPDGFGPLKELAEVLGGAVAASRAVVDAGWLPYAHQVGQTGKTVQPDLYIACGISGAVQHLAGMKTARCIVAINKDPEAPIFNYAHFGIVGDLFEYVPALTVEFKRRLT
jgi:electron transfer flavoprotein alpha subunit